MNDVINNNFNSCYIQTTKIGYDFMSYSTCYIRFPFWKYKYYTITYIFIK